MWEYMPRLAVTYCLRAMEMTFYLTQAAAALADIRPL